MEYEDLLKLIDEEGRVGNIWSMRIIMHLLDSENPVDEIKELDTSCRRMFTERQREIPEKDWETLFGGAFDSLLKRDVIGYFHPLTDKWYDTANVKRGSYPVTLRQVLTPEQHEKVEMLCAEQIERNMLLVRRGKSVVTADEDRWFAGLDYKEKNKLHVTQMIERMEIVLRQLLKKKYEEHGDWTRKKEFVMPGLIDKMYGVPDAKGVRRGGDADRKAERTLRLGGTPLGSIDNFLNACTLGESFGIILYRAENFTSGISKKTIEKDVFYGGRARLEWIFDSLMDIRNPRAHADESLTWNIDLVGYAKTLTDGIINAVTAYLNR